MRVSHFKSEIAQLSMGDLAFLTVTDYWLRAFQAERVGAHSTVGKNR
jgi:hypothetical protein